MAAAMVTGSVQIIRKTTNEKQKSVTRQNIMASLPIPIISHTYVHDLDRNSFTLIIIYV